MNFFSTFVPSLTADWLIVKYQNENIWHWICFSVWSKDGCTIDTHNAQMCYGDNNDVNIDCMCNHTTSYAILMSFSDYESPYSLTIVSYVGCGVSLVFLITSFIIFIYLKWVIFVLGWMLMNIRSCCTNLKSIVKAATEIIHTIL